MSGHTMMKHLKTNGKAATHIRDALPCHKDPASQAKRAELFSQFDMNGNGYLSLAEIDKGVRDALNLPELFDAKPVMMRAYQLARHVRSKGKPSVHGDDFITRPEFRLLLLYLTRYMELWEIFSSVDAGGDHKLSLAEFKAGLPKLEAAMGFKIADPDAGFKAALKHGDTQLLFDEFADYIIGQHCFDHDDEA